MTAPGDDDADGPDLPEVDPAPRVTPGSASWAERAGDGPPPYEESADQTYAKWRARLMGAPIVERDGLLERRRKRKARIALLRDERAQERERKRLGERWRTT